MDLDSQNSWCALSFADAEFDVSFASFVAYDLLGRCMWHFQGPQQRTVAPRGGLECGGSTCTRKCRPPVQGKFEGSAGARVYGQRPRRQDEHTRDLFAIAGVSDANSLPTRVNNECKRFLLPHHDTIECLPSIVCRSSLITLEIQACPNQGARHSRPPCW